MTTTPDQKVASPAIPATAKTSPVPSQRKDPKVEAAINELVGELFKTRQVSSDNLICLIKIDSTKINNPRLLAASIERLLDQYFSIATSRSVKGNIKDGINSSFTSTSSDDLPERKVQIVFSGKTSIIEISGVEPKDGDDGYTELHFDWKKRSGALNENGVINWKDINSVPSVQKEKLLVTVFDRTLGSPGVTCLGKPVKQKPGKRHQIKWNANRILRKDDPKNPDIFNLYAANSGAVEFRLRIPTDPRTLDRIDIADTFTINGDINYDYGDIQSAANLDIKGNLKGNFSLQSEGFVHVTGSVEGKSIEASEVEASLITNGCKVIARKEIKATNINNAIATAENITIKKNASSAILHARNQLKIDEGSTILGVKAGCISTLIEQARITGKSEFQLGTEKFSRAEMLESDLNSFQTDISAISEEGKKEAKSILGLLIQVGEYVGNEPAGSPIKNALITLKKELIAIFQTFGEISEELVNLGYNLQHDLGDRNYNESIIRRADTMVKHMKSYNASYCDYSEIMAEKKVSQAEMDETTAVIKNNLFFETTIGLTAMSHNAEIIITCGNAELKLDQDSIPQGPFKIAYTVPENTENLRDGELRLTLKEV